jgi:hypothetical protein
MKIKKRKNRMNGYNSKYKIEGRYQWAGGGDYYRIVIVADNNHYFITKHCFDCEKLKNDRIKIYISSDMLISSFLDTLKHICFIHDQSKSSRKYISLYRRHILLCTRYDLDPTFNPYGHTWLILSGKYIKILTANECKLFLTEHPETIVLKYIKHI